MQKTRFLIIASLSLAVAGCGSLGANTSLYSTNQPVVTRTNYALDVNSDGGGISANENRRMAEWLDALQLRYGDRVTIDFGNGYENAGARRSVQSLLDRYGLSVSETAPVTAGNVTPGTFRLLVTRSSASVPNCPNWTKTTESNFNSSVSPNYGCASNSNLAAMVADPEDLVRGRDDDSRDANKGSAAINTFHTRTTGGKP